MDDETVFMSLESDYHLTVEAADDLCALYEPHPAWGERSRDEVIEIVEGSDEVVGIWDTRTDVLVASARVLTDYRVQAMVYDVIVAESRRGEGLGQQIMNVVAEHPELQEVTLTLHCREGLAPFYEQCGYVFHDRDVEMADGTLITYRTMKLHRS